MNKQFTKEQQQAIVLRNQNILVSAAAGSGKTAVLVERIIRMISEGERPADIDRLLIVTFTSAAAAEMRERIIAAISGKLALEPENGHLQRQSALIHNAQITTIHSFCLFVIRNHFQEIGLDPAFRVADEGEIGLLMQDVLAEVLEEAFAKLEQENKAGEVKAFPFRNLVETYGAGKKETALEESILSLYRFAMSYPWPEIWLKEHGEDYAFASAEELEQASFMKYIMEYLGNMLPELAERLKDCIRLCEEPDGPYMYGENLEKSYEALYSAAQAKSFADCGAALERVLFERLSAKKDASVDGGKRESVKQVRNNVKKQLEQIKEQFFSLGMEAVFEQCREVSPLVRELAALTIRFGERFAQKKREKNLLDFSDMEHLALDILCRRKENEEGIFVEPTAAALELRDYFQEIMTDEYQDSNLVQECILSCISGEEGGKRNRFMVGDVKQSIYKFRLARPELFMEKFYDYAQTAGGHLVNLHQNFRSREEVTESVNLVFSQLFARNLGGIDYDENARLHYGAVYYDDKKTNAIDCREEKERGENYKTELIIIERAQEEEKSAPVLEAEAIALRIRKLMRETKVLEKNSGRLRPLRYGDIVILLRSGNGMDEAFQEALERQEIPCFISSRTGYFQTSEVQTILQLLRILDNPLQDIPFFGVLKSSFASFTDAETAQIAAAHPDKRKLYGKIKRYAEGTDELSEKCRRFLCWYQELRRCSVWLSVHELLMKIMEESRYLEYVTALPGGKQRRANAQMLLQKAAAFEKTSFKGLYHFIRYIDEMEKYSIDYGEAGTQDELADVVRIMTIHKSKGLEFPVCIVAGMGRKMNRRDASLPVLTDMDMGVAVDIVDAGLRTRRKTLRKTALSRKILLDSQAEEMRILYVALTRAKEKLIITGVTDDAEKLLREKAFLLGQKECVLPYTIRSGAGSFLELLIACVMRTEGIKPLLRQYQIGKEGEISFPDEQILCKIVRNADLQGDLLAEEYKSMDDREAFKIRLSAYERDDKVQEYLQNRFGYQYPYENLQKLYAKTTVSELKMAAIRSMAGQEADVLPGEEAGGEKHLFEEETPAPYLPLFLRKEGERKKISGAVRGSAVHRVMELIDLKEKYDMEKLRADMEAWYAEGLLSEEYKEAVGKKKILRFMDSALAERMRAAAAAGKLWREQPFMLGIPASRLSGEFPETEQVLVQGIIDVFFEEQGEIVLLDYKTDVIKTPEELAGRYRVQLDYYQEALERIIGKTVKERILYSFYFEEAVEV